MMIDTSLLLPEISEIIRHLRETEDLSGGIYNLNFSFSFKIYDEHSMHDLSNVVLTLDSVPEVNRDDKTLTDGSPVTSDHKIINPDTGQQKGYVVLSEEERKRGFVRPVRQSYTHVGKEVWKYPLKDLTEAQKGRYKDTGYVKYEEYPEEETLAGRYWTQEDIDKVNEGCGSTTIMGLSIAETYARDPSFYGSTFCSKCKEHFPVGEFVWSGTSERVGS